MSFSHPSGVVVADASTTERVEFIRKTYLHLAGAVLAFMGVEALLLSSSFAEPLVQTMLGGRLSWFLVLGAFMLVGVVAEKWSRSDVSVGMQYLGLGLYVVAEAIVMLPMLYIATYVLRAPNLILEAGIYTALIVTGLTATVFFTRADFSWMRGALAIAGFAALGLVLVSMLFGFTLGSLFAAAMVVLAAGYILYYTSNVLHHYPVGAHVAAALALFSAVALLFWYVLRLLMNRR